MSSLLVTTFFVMTLAVGAQGIAQPVLTGPQMERFDKLTHELIAPCCWREPIAVHRSVEAQQMLDEVKQLVLEGRSEEEIKAIYVARYGLRILADPPGKEGKWLYIVPIAILCCVLFGVVWYVRSLATGVMPPRISVPPELMARAQMEIEAERRSG